MTKKAIIQVAVFDLNKTLYLKSSKEEFFKYICFRNNYKLRDIFRMVFFAGMKELSLLNKTEFKENFFRYLNYLPPGKVAEYAREFWSVEYPKYFHPELLNRIKHLRQKGVKVVFITGGLDVYVGPLFEHFLVPDLWLATRTQYRNGSYDIIGKACKDEEKVRRLQQAFYPQPFEIRESYSDKKEAILKPALQPWLLKDGEIWPVSDFS